MAKYQGKLHRLIKQKFYTQRNFSIATKTSEPVVSRVLSGTWKLTPEQQKAWAKALNILNEELSEVTEGG